MDRVAERNFRRGNLDIIEPGDQPLASGEERVLVGERQFVREQHPLVGDRNHVVVEGAGGDRLLRLLGKDHPVGVEAVPPRNGARRLEVLARGKRSA